MPRALLTPIEVTPAGVDPRPTAAATGGYQVVAQPGLTLNVHNGSGSTITTTIPTPGTVHGLPIDERVISVPAGATRSIDLGGAEYLQPDGMVYIDLSSVTTVTLGVTTNRVG